MVVGSLALLLKTFWSLTHLRRTFCFANGFPNHSLSGNMNKSSYLCPTAKQALFTYTPLAQGSRYFVIEGLFLVEFLMSSEVGGTNVPLVLHDWHWLAIYFSGSIDVCKVFGISILCLVMFGVVFSCGCIFFQQVFVLINVSQAIIWYATSEFTSTIPFSCELFHPAARFAWRTFLATIVGGGSFLWPFQRCRCWRYWSLKRCWRQSYVCSDIFGIKNWALVFSLKYWHISMQSIFWQWWFWWYLIMLDVLRFIC